MSFLFLQPFIRISFTYLWFLPHFYSALALLAKTNNGPESWHSGVSDRLPPLRHDINQWIDGLAAEHSRQHKRLIQARDKKKYLGPKPQQKKQMETIRAQCLEFGTISHLAFLEQFTTKMTINTDFDPQTPTEPNDATSANTDEYPEEVGAHDPDNAMNFMNYGNFTNY